VQEERAVGKLAKEATESIFPKKMQEESDTTCTCTVEDVMTDLQTALTPVQLHRHAYRLKSQIHGELQSQLRLWKTQHSNGAEERYSQSASQIQENVEGVILYVLSIASCRVWVTSNLHERTIQHLLPNPSVVVNEIIVAVGFQTVSFSSMLAPLWRSGWINLKRSKLHVRWEMLSTFTGILCV
jgi:hypothetical protein